MAAFLMVACSIYLDEWNSVQARLWSRSLSEYARSCKEGNQVYSLCVAVASSASRSVCKASFGSLAQFLEDSNFDAQFGSFQTSKSTRTRGGTGHRGAEDRVERGDRT